ncbi:DUF1648 domain-containing protein [Nonomuraea gerenzanensis]|uniref:DUF5808 domain-containing protein n=1 Tax=Nonomuraea gerenzanensis TaxID=93944 RepID=A0A1M4DZU2_9ACTN|nr:hypothetical protein [Nonomuraea gerenzanensis]UBU14367.1 hypothetical protein LCN96_04890 [Nonomuraea gerenzanensis]SBO92074.1 hypothetical protein BN4615_P1588 [Nonomuraea gerenzanensis]
MTPVVATLATVVLIGCVALITPALAQPTLPFGVRVPGDRAADPAVIAQRRAYVRLVLLAMVLSAPLAAAFGRLWLAAFGMTCLALYHRAHRRIRAAKQAGRWLVGRRQGVTVDTSFRSDPVRMPWRWILPAVAITLATAALGWWRYDALPATLAHFHGVGVDPARRAPTTALAAFEPVLFQVAVTLALPALTVVLLRARPDLDAARPAGSARRYRVYLRGMARLSLLGAACVNFSLFIAALRLWEVAAVGTAAAALPLAALVLGPLAWEWRAGQGGHRLPALPGEEKEDSGLVQRDDDRHWFLAGTVYANRQDPAVVLHARFGQSWTLNLGHPVTWAVVAALAALVLLALTGVIDLPERQGL